MPANSSTKGRQIRLMPMVVKALRDMNGTGRAAAVKGWIADKLSGTGQDLQDRVLSSGALMFTNDIQWARMYLVNADILEPMKESGHGVWKLTPKGWEVSLDLQTAQQIYEASSRKAASDIQVAPENDDEQSDLPGTNTWRSDLAKLLTRLPDKGFERLCAYIMTENGLEAKSTGKTGDGGIDGIGVLPVDDFGLVKMRVAWQCKRYKDNKVPSKDIRDFRGAIAGRAEYGIFFTTSEFTPSAESEAERLESAQIKLVNLEDLINLFKDNHNKRMGVIQNPEKTTEMILDKSFFEEYINPKGESNPEQSSLPID